LRRRGTHRRSHGPDRTASRREALSAGHTVTRHWHTGRQATLLLGGALPEVLPPGLEVSPTNMQELVLAYMHTPDAQALPGPRAADDRMSA
jgi:hypothetical protein